MWRRLSPLVAVGLPLLTLVVGLRALTRLIPEAAIPWPAGVVSDGPRRGGYRSEQAPDLPWVLIVGGSATHAAFALDGLKVPARKQIFSGGYPSDVYLALTRTFDALPKDRWPAQVIWGINAGSLVDRSALGQHPCLTQPALSRGSPVLLRLGLCEGLPLSERLLRLDPWFLRREAVMDALASHLYQAWHGSLPEPPAEVFNYQGQDPDAARRNLEAWARLGVFGEAPFDPRQEAALLEVAALCQSHGVPLKLIALPEPSATRARYAPAARARFMAQLRRAGPTEDWFDALPDEGFFDQAHPNERGRAQLTVRLAGALR